MNNVRGTLVHKVKFVSETFWPALLNSFDRISFVEDTIREDSRASYLL